MSQKSPLEVVNEKFGGKDKLVDKLVGILESDESKDELRKRLLAVANRKLLRLHNVASTVKEKFGSRDKLLDQAIASAGRTKDKDYRAHLEAHSTSRLVDIANVSARRTKTAAAEANPDKTRGKAKSAARAKEKTTAKKAKTTAKAKSTARAKSKTKGKSKSKSKSKAG
jgi:hypothetical protein